MFASVQRTIYTNAADFTALASSAAEGSLLAGPSLTPAFLPFCLEEPQRAKGKRWEVTAAGVFSTTGTPTLTFNLRLGTASAAATLTGAVVGNSAAITTASGVTNAHWWLKLYLTCHTPGVGANACTVQGHGFVASPAGFGTPLTYLLCPASGTPQTWTQTVDGGVTNYLNLTATWSASSASNTITCKDLEVEEKN